MDLHATRRLGLRDDRPFDRQHRFAVQPRQPRDRLRVLDDDLRQSLAVPQDQKRDVAAAGASGVTSLQPHPLPDVAANSVVQTRSA